MFLYFLAISTISGTARVILFVIDTEEAREVRESGLRSTVTTSLPSLRSAVVLSPSSKGTKTQSDCLIPRESTILRLCVISEITS